MYNEQTFFVQYDYFVEKLNNQIVLLGFVVLFSCLFMYKALTKKDIYLNYTRYENIVLIKSEIPMLVLSDKPNEYVDLIPFIADRQQYEFPYSLKSLNEKLNKYDKAYVLIHDVRETGEKIVDFSVPKGYELKNRFRCGEYFFAYELDKIEK